MGIQPMSEASAVAQPETTKFHFSGKSVNRDLAVASSNDADNSVCVPQTSRPASRESCKKAMVRQHAAVQNRKSIMAAALIGLGLLILFRSVAEAPVLIRFLRIIGDQADSLGVIAAGSMAVQHGLQGYLFNHSEFLRVVYQVLLSFLGLLFIVMGGTLAAVFAGGEGRT